MFGRKNEEVLIPKKSLYKSFKKLILVTCLLFSGGLLVLNGYNLIQFNPELIKYTGIGLLALALIYHFMY